MITKEHRIRPIGLKKRALDVAEECYEKWKSNVPFELDVADHLLNGVVISRPDLFGMAKIVNIAPEGEKIEPAWFVRMSVGHLPELLRNLPVHLPKICFCRRNDGRVRIYSLDRLIAKAKVKGGK